MKIRIQNNTVRIRLNDREVTEFKQGNKLTSLTQFPGGNLNFSLNKGTANLVHFDQGMLTINVQAEQIEHWADSDEVTIAMEFDISNEEKLSILVEKDMKI